MVPAATLITAAIAWWGAVAPAVPNQCPDGVRYNVRATPDMVNPMALAQVHQWRRFDGYIYSDCVITFRKGWRRLIGYDNQQACSVVIHEVGHAAFGMTHKSSYRVMHDIDAENTGRWIPRACR